MNAANAGSTRIAIIPARGGSKRVPRKNLHVLAGQPLVSYPIRAALASGMFDRVFVSTEDDEIATVATEFGAEILPRPKAFADDVVNVPDVVRFHLNELSEQGFAPDYYCIIYATAVLLAPEDLVAAWRVLDDRDDVDFVVSVSEFPLHPNKAMSEESGYLRPIYPDRFVRPSQEYEDLVAPNGTFHWGRTLAFLSGGSFEVARRVGYRLPYHRAVDIDVMDDLRLAERLLDT